MAKKKQKLEKKGTRINSEYAYDKKAAEKYNRIVSISDSYRMHECSDGTVLDFMGTVYHGRKKTGHLSKQEKAWIEARYNKFSKLKMSLGRLKKKAFGSNQSNKGSLLEARKAELLEMFGRYYSTPEVHKKLAEDGMNLNIDLLRRFRIKYKLEIEKLQSDYDKEYDTVGVARKRSRLEQLDYIIRRYRQEFDEAQGKNMLPYGREIIKVLEQARKEVEGEQVHLHADGTINITATIESSKSVEQLYSEINFMNLLIARVAARMQVDPLMIQHQLTNSWYAKFTGLKRNDNLMNEIPEYPSKIILNWGDIKDKAAKKEKEYNDLKEKFKRENATEVQPEEQEEINKIRENVVKKLKLKQKYIDDTKDRMSGKSATKRDIKELIKEIKSGK